MDNFPHSSQLFLPTDKSNPAFSIYRSRDDLSIEVFYGLELLDTVPNVPDHQAFKMLVGRLYNAKFRVQSLEDAFDIDRKTIASWGKAILSHDPAVLERVMLGRRASVKRSPTLDNYVFHRWVELQSRGLPNFRLALAQDVLTIFGISISGETLRQIYLSRRPLDTQAEPAMASPTLEEQTCSQTSPGTSSDQAAEEPEPLQNQTSSPNEQTSSIPPPSKSTPPNLAPDPQASAPERAHLWAPALGQARLCDHLGLLIFSSAINTIANATQPPEPILAQWFTSILLGALNVEQTKYLNWDDLRILLGHGLRHTGPQREELTRLATAPTIDALLRWNLSQIQLPSTANDFYYDPHTSHYTGSQNILKGWCANIRWADKLINSDYIHTAAGEPIYFECTDNYEDLRARFLPLIKRMRQSLQLDGTRPLTIVVDRGIYSNEVFTTISAEPHLHIITWEKGYQACSDTEWDALVNEHRSSQTYGLHTYQRTRNHSRDRLTYSFSYIHRPWSKNPALKQIIVRATNPRGRTTEVSVLTDDKERPSQQSVQLIFQRWVQENDFKYLDKHFGINQLTSYRSTPYEQLRNELEDRQVTNPHYHALSKHGRKLSARKASQLLAAHNAARQEDQRQQRLQALDQSTPKSPPRAEQSAEPVRAAAKEQRQLQEASKRHHHYRQLREEKITYLDTELEANAQAKAQMEREVSRLDQLIEEDKVRMNLSNKTLMDTLKISARNLFYRIIRPFQQAYDNRRDDHDHYRQLTQSNGVLKWNGEEIEAHITPRVNYEPKLKGIIQDHLASLNATGLIFPDGSGRKLRLLLTRKEQISVQVNSPTLE